MNKDEILAASRNENKEKDPVRLEIEHKGNGIAFVVLALLAFAFFALEIAVGRGQNYGFLSLIVTPLAVTFGYKAIKLHRKTDIWMAVIYTLWAAVAIYGYFHFILA